MTKIMKIKEFLMGNIKKLKIQNYLAKILENHKTTIEFQLRIMKIKKFQTLHASIMRIMKILELQSRIQKIMKIIEFH